MKQLIKIYEDAPPIGKVLLICVVILLAYFIFRAIKKILEPIPSNQNLLDASKDELSVLASNGETTHYSASQFAGFADSLEQAMSGLGTDEDAIASVFKYMQNKADVLQLIKTFGIRNYTDDRVMVGWNEKPFNLGQWIAIELDQDDIEEYINNQLKSKGINYSF